MNFIENNRKTVFCHFDGKLFKKSIKNVDFRPKILEVAISENGDFEKWIISKIVSF